jgi:hypothetical protein
MLAAQQALANPQVQAALRAQSAAVAQQLSDPAALAAMSSVMPQLMRSQRVMALAMAKQCPFTGAGLAVPPVPAVPPTRK